MQIILLEKVVNVGNLGEVVKVKDGYARNFLIPQRLARRATATAVAEFEVKRAELESCCRQTGRIASPGRKTERPDRSSCSKSWCRWPSVRFRHQLRHR